MVAKGHFQELHQLMEFIERANDEPLEVEGDEEGGTRQKKEKWERVQVGENEDSNDKGGEGEGDDEGDEGDEGDDGEKEISELARSLQSGKSNQYQGRGVGWGMRG